MRPLARTNTADAGRILHSTASMAHAVCKGQSMHTRHISMVRSQLSCSLRGRWSRRTARVGHQIVQRRHARVQHRSHVARGIGHLWGLYAAHSTRRQDPVLDAANQPALSAF